MRAPASDYYELRTEWLRYKSRLFDRLTGLPTLPAVVEQARRLLEDAAAIEVLALDPGGAGRQETLHGWAAYDRIVQELARLLASLRSSGELASRDLLCLHGVGTDRFLMFLAAGPSASGRMDGVLAALHQRLASVPNGSPLHGVRLAVGRARLRQDPMLRAERAIQQAVTDAIFDSLAERGGGERARREELLQLIAQADVRCVFHPIVRLADRAVVGHEALTRPLRNGAFASVEDLFAFAESTEQLLEFERLCRTTAIRSSSELAQRGLLFLNASARAVEDAQWTTGEMDALLAARGLSPADVVVEITERVAIERHADFQRALRQCKQRGYRVAVDDMGAGYASFSALAAIEPDFLKFDVSLVRDIDRSSIKRSLLETLRALASKIRARVIAEGVEREGERETLLALGIELGQGFLFHREEA